MDKLEYIQGDLVMTNGKPIGTKEGIVYRVTSSDPSKTLKLKDGTVLKGVVRLENIEGVEFGDKGYLLCDCCAWVKHIVPIKLTTAILEANEWKKGELKQEDNARAYYYSYSKKGCIVELRYYTSCDMFLPYIGQEALMNILFLYVHQLQNLLFGLNLPMDLKV